VERVQHGTVGCAPMGRVSSRTCRLGSGGRDHRGCAPRNSCSYRRRVCCTGGRARRLDHVTGAAFLRLRRALVNLHCESDLRAQWLKRLPADISGMLGRIWLEDMQIPISRHLTQAEPSGLRSDFSKALLLSIESAAQFNSWVTKLREYPEEFFPSQWASMRRLMQDIAMKVCEHAATALKIGHPIAG